MMKTVNRTMTKAKPDSPAKKRHEEYAERIIAMLEKGMAPWQKPWAAGAMHPPFNPVSGTVYSGINRVMLSEYDFADPRWMSFKQANQKGYRVKKGEKSQPIVHWQWTETVDKLDEDGKPVLDTNGQPEKEVWLLGRPRIRFFSVFHASQLQLENGQPIPPFEPKELDWQPHERAEAILEASGAKIIHDQRDRAFYALQNDEIHLPPKENFGDEGQYYPIALHELSHWTRHPSRLNRENGPFGSESYAREELRAHIASWMLSQDLGIAFNPDHQAAYLQSWVKVLKDDPYQIFRACSDAERIKKYVLGLDRQQDQAAEITFSDTEPGAGDSPALDVAALSDAPGNDDRGVPAEPVTEPVFLNVPYKEKNEAKKAGARWDSGKKLWYAPTGADLGKLARFLPEKEPALVQSLSPVEEFRQVLENNGFVLNGDPIMDGKIHRVPIVGKPNQRDGAYQAYADGVPNGWFENHRDGNGTVTKWVYSGQTLSPEEKRLMQAEIDQRREQAQKEREDQYAKAAERVFDKFAACAAIPVDPEHLYLKSKGVGNFGLHQDHDGNLLVFGLNLDESDFPGKALPEAGFRPSLDDLAVTRHIQTVQTIAPDGGKKFEYGSRKHGAVHLIGEGQFKKIAYDHAFRQASLFDDLEKKPEILLAEGYATGASLHQATGLPVAVAFDAGNLLPVAEALRRKFPNADLTICADHDHTRKFNVGLGKAYETARAVGVRVVFPQFTEDEKAKGLTDFNDLAQSRGIFEVTKQVSPRHREQAASVAAPAQADRPAKSLGMAM